MTLISKLIGIDATVQSQRRYLSSCRHIGKTDFVLKLKDLVLLCEEDKSWSVDLVAQVGPMKSAIAQLGLEMKTEIELHIHDFEVVPDRFCGFLTNGCSWVLVEQNRGMNNELCWRHSDSIQVFSIATMELVGRGIDTVTHMFLYAIETFSALGQSRLQEDLDIDDSTRSGEDLSQLSDNTSQSDINEEHNAEEIFGRQKE